MSTVKTFYHPHVNISTEARRHSVNPTVPQDTTILFTPIVASKGPDGEVVKVHSLSEFVSIYGSLNEDFYNQNGQMALNIYNWLSNGGTLLTTKLTSNKSQKASFKSSKYTISLANGYKIYNKVPTSESNYTYSEITSDKLNFIDSSKNSLTLEEIFEKLGTNPIIVAASIEMTGNVSGLSCILDGNIIKTEAAPATTLATINTETVFEVNAKYTGTYYNNISVAINQKTDDSDFYNIFIYLKINSNRSTLVERYTNIRKELLSKILLKSEYIDSNIAITTITDGALTASLSGGVDAVDGFRGTDSNKYFTETLLESFYSNGYVGVIDKSLETPIDVILDAGYSQSLKSTLYNFVADHYNYTTNKSTTVRDDIFLFLDNYASGDNLKLSVPSEAIYNLSGKANVSGNTIDADSSNVAVYTQYFKVQDDIFTDQEIYVLPSYAISKLLPYNDSVNGIQYPLAGLRRGVIDDAITVNENFSADEKETLFEKRINYAEKSSREIAFMNQRTYDGSSEMDYTALSFINNSRVLLRMKKDLEVMARNYLHEFNDAITISNLSSLLNKYVNNWISNRTLSYGFVEVSQSDVSENELLITLNIKFTNTIEVISISILVD